MEKITMEELKKEKYSLKFLLDTDKLSEYCWGQIPTYAYNDDESTAIILGRIGMQDLLEKINYADEEECLYKL